ncbi:MAG: alpha/beta hydrolase [Pseudomonadales bacterium]
MPSPELEAMVQSLLDAPIVGAPSLEEERAGFEEMLCAFPLPENASVTAHPLGEIEADWVSVPEADSSRAILYLHGGGYVIGSHKAYREFAARLASACKARVLVLNYRLAPEHPFPAAVDDAVLAYRDIREQSDIKHVAIAGDSAGGGLTVATMLALKNQGLPQPDCAICLSPWTDLTISGASAEPGAVSDPMVSLDRLKGMASQYAEGEQSNPLASPLFGDLAGLPPLYIAVGTRELLLDDTRRFVERARAAGVSLETEVEDGLIHIWPVFPTLPEAAPTLANIGRFTDANFG